MSIVQEPVNCSTAEEFLQELSPLGEYFRDDDIDAPWLFRGQGKDWPLIPSLFRENGKIKDLTHRNISDYPELLRAERDVLISFFKIADKRGLVLPDDSQELRSSLERLSDDYAVGRGLEGWKVTDSALSLMALAQHYGIPTRLLDWTQQAFIAAFFAGEDALQNENQSGELIVWSFYFPLLGKSIGGTKDSYTLRSVTAPSATNPNLKAQQGVFTLVNSEYTNESDGRYLPLDSFLDIYVKKFPNSLLQECKLTKFTLPTLEASQLLRLLARQDITPSAIYPGYQSILSDLKMRNLWD
jgi:hypothetical protein